MDTKGRILIIDDEEGIRKGCSRVLKPAGYEIELASSFGEGLRKVLSGQYDLVLLDVMMPDGRGIDLLEPVRERDPEAVVILITGYATVELAVDAIKRGAYDFISKPFSGQLLQMTVEQGLQKRRLSLEAKRLQSIEKQLAELQQAREQAERLSEFKSAFATMVAHELRSPIGASQTLVRTLLRGLAGGLTAKQAELLGRVELRLDTLLKLVNDLLTLAASKSLEAEKPLVPVEVQPVLERVLHAYRDDALSKRIDLQYARTGCDPVIRATVDGLETVLTNLVCNAVKYTPQDGSVNISLDMQDDCAVLRIADTGIGIPEEDIARLGEEFFRGGNARGSSVPGTGLGLSIVKELLQSFGARLEIQSRVDRGTTVVLSLPLWKEPVRAG